MTRSLLGCRKLHVQYYDRHQPTLNDITLTIHQGEFVLFLGPSGCGKSTLMHVLSGVIPRSIDAHVKGEVWRPNQVGILFQDPESQFCMLRLADEIAFSLENKQIAPQTMPEMIEKLKKRVGLEHLPDTASIHTLSGGQKQRLALATVLALEPEVLFLDEPTAQLDPAGTEQLLSHLHPLSHDHTLVLVEHKLDGVIDGVDRVILFSPEGKIIDDGAPARILRANDRRLSAYGIWKPRLWPTRWEEVLDGKENERIAQWKPLRRQRPSRAKRLLHVCDASICYNDHTVWRHVDLEVEGGEWIAVLGPNGSGKSSFLKALMGLIPLRTGKIHYDFLPDLIVNRPEMLAQHVGFVFQNPEHQFVTDSVFEEVAFTGRIERWPERQLVKRVNQLLKTFHLDGLREANPYTLSVGQKRRLSVASMLLKTHRLLLLDEPTFGQDAATSRQLIAHLDQLHQKGTTIMMATHDVDLAYRYTTKAIVFAGGRLLFTGTPQQLFANGTLVKQAGLQTPLHMEYLRRKADSTSEVRHA